MFGELPKLFDRDFAVGFLLPAAVLAAAIWAVLNAFGLTPNSPNPEVLAITAIVTGAVWFLAIALLALNYSILRFLEGYSWQHLLRWRERFWRNRFRKEAAPMLRLQREYFDAAKNGVPQPALPPNFSRKLRDAVE